MLVKVEVYHDGESWCARGIGENIREAVGLHFEGRVPPSEVDILIVSELKLTHAPAASS